MAEVKHLHASPIMLQDYSLNELFSHFFDLEIYGKLFFCCSSSNFEKKKVNLNHAHMFYIGKEVSTQRVKSG